MVNVANVVSAVSAVSVAIASSVNIVTMVIIVAAGTNMVTGTDMAAGTVMAIGTVTVIAVDCSALRSWRFARERIYFSQNELASPDQGPSSVQASAILSCLDRLGASIA
jgi:hypothetical protein